MAPSSWYDSHLNLTSGLLSVLDLNCQENQKMENTDIDPVIDVPDTPDRLAAQNIDGNEGIGKESNTSVAGHSGNSGILDEGVLHCLRGRSRLIPGNRHNKRLFRSHRNFNDFEQTKLRKNTFVHLSENSSASGNALLHRRMIANKPSSNENAHSIGAHHMDKGKVLSDRYNIKPSACQEGEADLDQKEQNGCSRILGTTFRHGSSKNPLDGEIREGSLTMPSSSKTGATYRKGKEKVDEDTDTVSGMDHWVGIDFTSEFQPKTAIPMSAPLHSLTSTPANRQKRLVRNGCISPHNIAKVKQLAGQNGTKDVGHNDKANVASSSPSCLIDISDSSAEGNNHIRAKGKGMMLHPCTSRNPDARTKHFSGSCPTNHNKEAIGTSDVNGHASECLNGLSGWRSTRNRSKKTSLPQYDEDMCFSRIHDGDEYNQLRAERLDRGDNQVRNYDRTEYEVWNRDSGQHWSAPPLAQTAVSLVSDSDLANRQHSVANTVIKRQKKLGPASINRGESSAPGINDSGILFLGSSRETSSSRSTRNQGLHNRRSLEPVIEIDESSPSPQMGPGDSQPMGHRNDDDSDVRARQVEADEILARELQEQLYQEVPISGGGEIDEPIAWMMHHQGDTRRASSSESHRILHPRGSSPLYRQSRVRSLQNHSGRRGTQARGPLPARMTQLRSRFRRQVPSILPRESNLFPLDMDLDMRIDILEALEAAVGDLSDDLEMTNDILQVQRDFNENDYEMLLALDDNNYQHGGASIDQISRLPQSTVQSDNFQEACAICLETPTSGDIIRHLPCLHKFHKDCIDPWLSRRTSCPICKSSVT